MTRRDFVRAVLASSAFYGIGCGSGSNYTPPTPPPSACGSLDCAIVGAGIGGMSAASALIAAGKNVVVLEARNRVCGELLILAECTVEVQTCESFAHG
jgi:monoamine oxidase